VGTNGTLPPSDLDLRARVVDQMADAVVLADREGVIRLWNRGAEVLFGFSAAEALGSTLDLIVPAKFWRGHEQGFRRACASGSLRLAGQVMTTRSNHRHGCRLYVDFTFGMVKDDAGGVLGIFAVGRDATARHMEEVAAKVRCASAEAEHAQGEPEAGPR
jgi:PAS domain S-box-containing protein